MHHEADDAHVIVRSPAQRQRGSLELWLNLGCFTTSFPAASSLGWLSGDTDTDIGHTWDPHRSSGRTCLRSHPEALLEQESESLGGEGVEQLTGQPWGAHPLERRDGMGKGCRVSGWGRFIVLWGLHVEAGMEGSLTSQGQPLNPPPTSPHMCPIPAPVGGTGVGRLGPCLEEGAGVGGWGA